MRGLRFGLIALAFSAIPAISAEQSDLTKPAGKEWLTIGGDWHNTRYSTLAGINLSNVKNLQAAGSSISAPGSVKNIRWKVHRSSKTASCTWPAATMTCSRSTREPER